LASMSVTPSAPKPLRIAAAVIGNALEWYDFIIFGLLTVIIAKSFFQRTANTPRCCALLVRRKRYGIVGRDFAPCPG
jgi:hypothetical protein